MSLLNKHTFGKKASGGGGFSPLEYDPELWIDAGDAGTLFTDAGTTPVAADGDTVYRINDKSDYGNHLGQTDSAKRPQYKTGIQNGLSALFYNNAFSQFHTVKYAAGHGVTDYQIFVVSKLTAASTNYDAIVGGVEDGGQSYYHRFQTGSGNYRWYPRSSPVTTNKARTLKAEVLMGDKIGNTSTFYQNGVSGGAVTTGGMFGSHGVTLAAALNGTTGWHTGNILEVIAYTRTMLNSDEVDAVYAYLNEKWAI